MDATGILGSVRAMACDVTVRTSGVSGAPGSGDVGPAVDTALRVFRSVHRAATRFDPDSPLMRANAHPDRWHPVPAVLFAALGEAHRAHLRTRGRFDPRILDDLERLGYDRNLRFHDGPVRTSRRAGHRRPRGRWRPGFRGGPRPQVNLGGVPVDLGGIGKGLALRWAGEGLTGVLDSYLIDAGGDVACRGPGVEGDGWRIGVEDPAGGTDPLAVLVVRDRAVATSSIRLRRWTAGDEPVHHLIDPRTGRPGGTGLTAVTVVADDPAEAEVTTKALFLCGARGIAAEAERRSVAALWVGVDGSVSITRRLRPSVIWTPG